MPNPREIHVDAALSNIANQYPALSEGFIAGEVCPAIPVKFESDKYFVFGAEELSVINDTIGDRSEAGEIDWHVSTASYTTIARALKGFVSKRSQQNADSAVRPLVATTEKIARTLALNKEVRVVAAVVAGITSSSHTTAIGDAWATASSGLPLANIATGKESFRAATGRYPNTIVIPAGVVPYIVACAEYKGAYQYVTDYRQSYDTLPPSLMGLNILVPEAVKSSVDITQATYDGSTIPTTGSIWTSDSCYLLYVNKSPSLEEASFMYELTSAAQRTRKWFDPTKGLGGGTFIQTEYQSAIKVVNGLYAWELDNVI